MTPATTEDARATTPQDAPGSSAGEPTPEYIDMMSADEMGSWSEVETMTATPVGAGELDRLEALYLAATDPTASIQAQADFDEACHNALPSLIATARRRSVAGLAWRPISEAPTDGTRFVYRDGEFGNYGIARHYTDISGEPSTPGWYDDNSDQDVTPTEFLGEADSERARAAEALEQRVKSLEEGLRFYGNEEAYPDHCTFSDITNDCGAQARALLTDGAHNAG